SPSSGHRRGLPHAGAALASPGSCGLLPRLAPVLRRDIGVEPLANRGEMRPLEVALEQAPHPRLELAVVGLVVALPQPREAPKDPGVAVRSKHPIGALE